MLNRVAYWNSRPGGVGALEVVAEGEGAARQFVPLRRTELRGEVAGPLAALRLVHTYQYARAECDRTLEAIYRFPLPGDAAVTGVTVRFGEVEIRAELQERQQAEATYEEAKAQGHQAALATRESPDVFTLRVAGLRPDEPIVVETAYIQLARPEGGGWSLRVPLTTAPRYVREDEAGSRHAAGQPLAVLRDPGHRFALDLLVRGAERVTSPTHPLALGDDDGRLRVRLEAGEVLPDRDCVLAWQPRQEGRRPTLQVFLHDDPTRDQVYFLALVAPPAVPDQARAVPREVVLLVDHSGSMGGAKWQAADWAVKSFLSGLAGPDAFALGVFHDSARWFGDATRAATPEAVGGAIAFLEGARDSGGTNLGVALEQALRLPRAAGERARHLLVVTDAEVSDAARVLRLADEEAARAGDRRRISVLCIDAAPNAFLAQELAERGGGVARFLTSSPEEEDIATALDEVLADWAAPTLAGLRLSVNRAGAQAASGAVRAGEPDWSAIELGDLPLGRAVWVAGRAPRGAGDDLAFHLTAANNADLPQVRLSLATAPRDFPALKALFGARRVTGLEYLSGARYTPEELRDQLRRLGYGPETALADTAASPALYAENARQDTAAALKGLLVREALDYGLASAETAFVAVRRVAGKLVEGTVAVGNALPAGWSETFVGGAAQPMMRAITMPTPMRAAAQAMPPSFAAPTGSFRAIPHPAARRSALGRLADAAKSFLAGGGGDTASVPADAAPSLPSPAPSPATFSPAAPPVAKNVAPLFAGTPHFANGEAVLFDSSRPEDAGRLPAGGVITQVRVRFGDAAPDPARLDPGLTLLVYVDDLAAPRARVRLADLLRQGGARPLNLTRRPGQVVRLVLADPAGAWAQGAPALEVELGTV